MKPTFAMLLTLALTGVASGVTLYSETFEGLGSDPLNGALTADSNGIWSANSFARGDGSIMNDSEGSAILPVTLVSNRVYTLSLDVLNSSDNWIALGFKQNALSAPGSDNPNDRFSDSGGQAWMRYSNNGAPDAVQAFIGGSLAGALGNQDTTGIDFMDRNNLRIIIDTTGDGSSFVATYYINGDFKTFGTGGSIGDLQYMGFSFGKGTSGGQVEVDNLLLTAEAVPEPSTALLGMAAALALLRRRR